MDMDLTDWSSRRAVLVRLQRELKEQYFKDILPCDILQYFYSPSATIFYPAITRGMPLTDYYPDQLVGELYYLRRYYSKEQAEKKDYARHLRWYEILLNAGKLSRQR